ncbi:ATP-binding protein [Roseateles sp. DB2]|uniref:PAS domain-containing hybrid sensor histidine kinase/response regulator n=1 Tax=Roseateles sp. DB2 TaxID=3453717 RepID=UPI003EEC4B65
MTPDSTLAGEAARQLLQALSPGDSLALLDLLPLGLVLMDSQDGRLMHLNREAERLLSLRGATVLGQPLGQGVDPALAELCAPARWQTLREGRRGAREDLRVQTPFGPRWLQVQRLLMPLAGQRRTLAVLMLQDANARRQLERALQESDTRFREVTDAVSECLFVTNAEWDRLHFSSPLLLDTLGLSPMDLRHGPRLFEERIHPEDRALYQRRLLAQAAGESSDMVLRIQHPSRGLRWVRLRTRVQVHAGGAPLVYGILADVTEEQQRHRELQAARDKAESASQAKSLLMANMSHEFRTPMNGILGMTQLLLNTSLDQRQQHYARQVQASAEDLQHLLDDMLDLAHLEGEAAERRGDDCPLRPLLETLAAQYRPQAESRGLRLTLELPEDLPASVPVSAGALRRLLGKLLDNALKFTEQGEVRLLALHQPMDSARSALVLQVVDTGIGIPAEKLQRLFMPFTQGNASLARRYGGAGLGLAVAQQLAQQMGAQLEAAARPEGGSIFSLTLPLQNGAALDSPAQGEAPTAAPAWHILVVEDNPVNQEVIQQMLLQLGCTVYLTNGGEEGLRALGESAFDLVMMDIHMPGMDGIQALQIFRRGGDGRFRFLNPGRLPVIAVTANALSGDRGKLLAYGFDDYLPKPIRSKELQAVLQRQLGQPVMTGPQNAPAPAESAHLPDGETMPSATPPTTPERSAGCLDEASLQRLRDLDPSGSNQLLPRVINAFIKSLDKLLPDLQRAREAGMDLAAIRHVAHTLKSSSASLGALQLSRHCADIETMARNGQTEGLDKLIDAMHDEAGLVRHALEALLTGPQ